MAITTGRMNSDRISNLPDPILHDILGLLKPKEAVQTCVLSKRWKNLWTCLSSLDFNPADFTRKRYPAAVSHVWFADQVAGYERFVEFVSVFLFCCNHLLVLDKFQLSCQHNQISKLIFGKSVLEHARDWIRYAVRHNPRVLSLHFVLSRNSLSDIYTCMSVQELHLHECEVDVSGIVNLPSLRKLSFSKVDFILSNLKNILSGCPILEYLSLECCIWDESEIAHRSLQHLTIVSCTCAREIPRMFISAPNLLSFCYKWSPSKITLNVPSLTDARFIFPNSTAVWRGWKELAASLSALVNVEILEFELWAFWHDYRSQVLIRTLVSFRFLITHQIYSIEILSLHQDSGMPSYLALN